MGGGVYGAEALGILAVFIDKVGTDIAGQLFGSDGFGTDNVPREDTKPGRLRVDDAQLPGGEREVLSQDRYRGIRRGLYRDVFATAIEHASGAAQSGTLRGIEAVIPVHLETNVRWIDVPGLVSPSLPVVWPDIIERCLPLVRSVGAHRSRGFGRAVFATRRDGGEIELASPATESAR